MATPPAAAPDQRTRRGATPALEALAVALLVALAYALLLPPLRAAGAYGDDAVYLALGRALARGAGYRSTWLPGAPVHVQYPPGLPALLAPLWALGGRASAVTAAVRALDVLAVAAVGGLLWDYGRRRLRLSAWTLAPLALGPLFLDSSLQYFGLALAEPWFMLAWAGALTLADRGDDAGAANGAGKRRPLAAAALLGAAALFRAQAVALVPALALAVWLRRRDVRLAALSLAAGLAVPVAWAAVHAALRALAGGAAGGAQLSYLQDLAARGGALGPLSNVLFNARGYLLLFSLYAAPWLAAGALIVLGFTALALLGAARLWRAHPALVLTVGADAAVVLLWPYNIDRLVVSALPFAGLLAAAALATRPHRALAAPAAPARAPLRALVALALLAGVALCAARQVALRRDGARRVAEGRDPAFWSPSWEVPFFDRYVRLAVPWVRAETAPGARVLAAWPVALWLYTGRDVRDTEGAAGAAADSAAHAGADGGATAGAGALAAGMARQIEADAAAAVVVAHPGHRGARGMAALAASCPGEVRVARRARGGGGYPILYRIGGRAHGVGGAGGGAGGGGACLRRVAGGGGSGGGEGER